MITVEIHTLEDGLLAVVEMIRTYHPDAAWLSIAARIERVAETPDVCPVLRDDAVRAAVTYLAGRPVETAEVPAA